MLASSTATSNMSGTSSVTLSLGDGMPVEQKVDDGNMVGGGQLGAVAVGAKVSKPKKFSGARELAPDVYV